MNTGDKRAGSDLLTDACVLHSMMRLCCHHFVLKAIHASVPLVTVAVSRAAAASALGSLQVSTLSKIAACDFHCLAFN